MVTSTVNQLQSKWSQASKLLKDIDTDSDSSSPEFAKERTRFNVLSDTIGLFGRDPHPHLNDVPKSQETFDLLGRLYTILSNDATLSGEYGLGLREISAKSSKKSKSSGFSKIFKLGHKEKNLQVQSSVMSFGPSKWLINDSTKFSKLTQSLRSTNDRLDAIFPDTETLVDPETGRFKLELAKLDVLSNGAVLASISKSASVSAPVVANIRWRGKAPVGDPGIARTYRMVARTGNVATDYYLRQALFKTVRETETNTDLGHVILDAESNPDYTVNFFGTTSVEGYAAHVWETEVEKRNFTGVDATGEVSKMAEVPPEVLVQIVADLKQEWTVNLTEVASVKKSRNDEKSHEQLAAITGNKSLNATASELSKILNQKDFTDFTTKVNVLDDEIKLRALLRQFAIGGLLLKYVESGIPMPELTAKVLSTLIIARRWLALIDLAFPDQSSLSKSLTDHYELTDPNLHIQMQRFQQIHLEGLYKFASGMQWPHLAELNDVVSKLFRINPLAAIDLSAVELRDWSFGLVLPGKWHAHKIMSAMIQSTQSLNDLQLSFASDGLILKDVSYWRAPSVLSRVLGGLLTYNWPEGPYPMCGWVGPFVNKTTIAEGFPGVTGDIRIKAPRVAPVLQSRPAYPSSQYDWFIDTQRRDGETTAAWLKDIDDSEAWGEPEAPADGLDAKFNGISLASVGTNEYTASATFDLDGKNIKYKLCTTPLFVTLPTCIISGLFSKRHKVHPREKDLFTNVFAINQLDEIPDVMVDEKVVVINATGGKGSETLARAWCAEKGRHAIIRNPYGCCYTCCVRNARSCGLGFGIVIWVG